MASDESLSLSIEQKLRQRLSPVQVKFGQMLEMSAPEAEDEVRRALDDNPALEIAEGHDDVPKDEFTESPEDLQLADYRSDEDVPYYRTHIRNRSDDEPYYEPMAVDTSSTIIDALTAQLAEHNLTDRQRMMAIYVIGNLDDNGYLTRDVNSMAYDVESHTGVSVSPAEMKEVLEVVRSLDPPGIGAIDLRDCLLLQLKRLPATDTSRLATEVVGHYFDLFALKHYSRISASLGITPDTLREAVNLIRTLNPKPAALLGEDPADEKKQHIVPDFYVEAEGGSVTLTLPNSIPELQVEETFRDKHPAGGGSDAENEASLFIKQKRSEAEEFIQVVKMRQATLFRTMSAIVRIQHDFFANGEDESLLHPMILKDIAAITHDDLSVISRATSGKYVATPSAIYPLRMFFKEHPRVEDSVSSREAMAALKTLVEGEDKSHPLSDEAIMSELDRLGYPIARRTVAKYREKLGIPVARLRREI
ncbi:MAG: RNA polymerase factor sigma-54 [Muribaculum sp.]|nr:RNA polymerase factor sigma-54 [Muribaculum sp.]